MNQRDILFPALATNIIFFTAQISTEEIDQAIVNLDEFERVHAAMGKHNAACVRQRIALAKAYLRNGEKEKAQSSFLRALGTADMFRPSIQTKQMLETEWRIAQEAIA